MARSTALRASVGNCEPGDDGAEQFIMGEGGSFAFLLGL